MIPRDYWLLVDGWNAAYAPKKPGEDAMTADQYRELVRRVDGN